MNNNLKEASDAMNRVNDSSFDEVLKQVREHSKEILRNSKDFQDALEVYASRERRYGIV